MDKCKKRFSQSLWNAISRHFKGVTYRGCFGTGAGVRGIHLHKTHHNPLGYDPDNTHLPLLAVICCMNSVALPMVSFVGRCKPFEKKRTHTMFEELYSRVVFMWLVLALTLVCERMRMRLRVHEDAVVNFCCQRSPCVHVCLRLRVHVCVCVCIGLWLLLCICFRVALRQLIDSVAVELGASFYASALPLTLRQLSHWHVNHILYWVKTQKHASAGGDAYETPRRGHIPSTKAKSEYVCFPLILTLTLSEHIKGAPSLTQQHQAMCTEWVHPCLG